MAKNSQPWLKIWEVKKPHASKVERALLSLMELLIITCEMCQRVRSLLRWLGYAKVVLLTLALPSSCDINA